MLPLSAGFVAWSSQVSIVITKILKSLKPPIERCRRADESAERPHWHPIDWLLVQILHGAVSARAEQVEMSRVSFEGSNPQNVPGEIEQVHMVWSAQVCRKCAELAREANRVNQVISSHVTAIRGETLPCRAHQSGTNPHPESDRKICRHDGDTESPENRVTPGFRRPRQPKY